MQATARRSHHQVLVSGLAHLQHSSKMRSAVAISVVVVVALSALLTQGQELKYPEREVVAELAAQIIRLVQGPWAPAAAGPHKRNSELINSILGLPKVMNDAGRR